MIEDSHDGADYVDGGAAGGGGEGTEAGAVHIDIICNLSSSLLSYICVLVAKRRRALIRRPPDTSRLYRTGCTGVAWERSGRGRGGGGLNLLGGGWGG